MRVYGIEATPSKKQPHEASQTDPPNDKEMENQPSDTPHKRKSTVKSIIKSKIKKNNKIRLYLLFTLYTIKY